MLPNGHIVVIDMAVKALDHPLTTKYRKAIILGALREDVWYLPVLKTTWEHLSICHFYKPGLPGGIFPFVSWGPRLRANQFFCRAVKEFRAGRTASAFVQLGRANHIIADLLCPVHAHRVIHQWDPFEWYVESHMEDFRDLPVPEIPDGERVSDLVEGLARFTQPFPADGTNHPLGRLLKRLGILEKPDPRLSREHAPILVAQAAGYSVAHLRMFLRTVGAWEPVPA